MIELSGAVVIVGACAVAVVALMWASYRFSGRR